MGGGPPEKRDENPQEAVRLGDLEPCRFNKEQEVVGKGAGVGVCTGGPSAGKPAETEGCLGGRCSCTHVSLLTSRPFRGCKLARRRDKWPSCPHFVEGSAFSFIKEGPGRGLLYTPADSERASAQALCSGGI